MTLPTRALLSLVAALLTTTLAFAHNGEPAALAYVDHPDHPAVVRTTYGLMWMDDAVTWTCGEIAAFDPFAHNPSMLRADDGGVLVASLGRLMRSVDAGCSFEAVLEGVVVLDLDAVGAHVVGVSFTPVSGGTQTLLWESSDHGASWAERTGPAGVALRPAGIARSAADPSRWYVPGDREQDGDRRPTLARSDDSGETWTQLDGPDATGSGFLAGVSPADADVLWWVISGEPSQVHRSTDGGASWSAGVEVEGAMHHGATSPDGTSLAVGSTEAGLWRVDADGTAVRGGVQWSECATWNEDGLFVCTDEQLDGYAVGRSTDGGLSFSPWFTVDDTCDPTVCPAEVDTQTCDFAWLMAKQLFPAPLTCWLDEPTDTGADTGDPPPITPEPTACGCAGAPSPGGLSILPVVGLAARRRRARTP